MYFLFWRLEKKVPLILPWFLSNSYNSNFFKVYNWEILRLRGFTCLLIHLLPPDIYQVLPRNSFQSLQHKMEEGCKRPNWPFKRHHQSSTKAARLLLDDPSKGLLFLGLLEVSYQVISSEGKREISTGPKKVSILACFTFIHDFWHNEIKWIIFLKKCLLNHKWSYKRETFWRDFWIADNEVTSCSYRFLKEFTVRVSQSFTWFLPPLDLGLENSFSERNCYGNCIKTPESW